MYHGVRKISIARFSMKNLTGTCPASLAMMEHNHGERIDFSDLAMLVLLFFRGY